VSDWQPWMGPTVSAYEASQSEAACVERDRQMAAWLGVEEAPFLAACRLYDLRKAAEDERLAVEEAAHWRLQGDVFALLARCPVIELRRVA